ncbi:hypothetical protein GCM10009800_10550 [Nocardiopsis rhodophaea]
MWSIRYAWCSDAERETGDGDVAPTRPALWHALFPHIRRARPRGAGNLAEADGIRECPSRVPVPWAPRACQLVRRRLWGLRCPSASPCSHVPIGTHDFNATPPATPVVEE